MILSRPIAAHIGKIVSEVQTDGYHRDDIVMCREVVIIFTDGTSIRLRTDWRGEVCYISEHTGLIQSSKPRDLDRSLTPEGEAEARQSWVDAAIAQGIELDREDRIAGPERD